MTRPRVDGESFGTAGSQPVERYTLTNGRGMRARILTLGGTVQTLEVPDRHGRLDNVVLGFADLEGYERRSPYFGCLVGRYANRIGGARFSLDGITYPLRANQGEVTLHGGPEGFDKRVWSAAPDTGDDAAVLRLRYVSPDGEMGFPGRLDVEVTYAVTVADELAIAYRATTDAPTVVNLTNHSYLNLAGEGSGDVYGHLLQIAADRYTPVREDAAPTGELAEVAGTPFDFREPRAIGERIRTGQPQLLRGQGYDHNFVLRPAEDGALRLAAHVREPTTGRTLTVRTTEPGLQFYSGNFLDGTLVGTGGGTYRQGDGLCLETQHFPDSPNQPRFPSTVLRPGQVYASSTVYGFSAS